MTGYVRVGVVSAVLTVLTTALLGTGVAELELYIGGKALGMSTLECLASSASNVVDLPNIDAGRIGDMIQKFSGCVLDILDAERDPILRDGGSDKQFTRLSRVRGVFKYFTFWKALLNGAEQLGLPDVGVGEVDAFGGGVGGVGHLLRGVVGGAGERAAVGLVAGGMVDGCRLARGFRCEGC